MIGNKSDITDKREITTEEANAFAKDKGIVYIETSAKTAKNVDKAFETVAEIVLDHIDKGQIDPTNEGGIKLGSGAAHGKGITLAQGNKDFSEDYDANEACSC